MKRLLFFLALLLLSLHMFAFEQTDLASMPTAGVLQKGNATVNAKLFGNDGIKLGTNVGLFRYFMFGVSYSGEKVVGSRTPSWQERVEFLGKFRVMDETENRPALVFGFDSQGSGRYQKENKRYDLKSRGFYLVISKNYIWNGEFGTHLGVNYSLENDDDDDLNIFFGFDKSLGQKALLLAEYDVALNDYQYQRDGEQKAETLGKGKGYLNTGVQINVTPTIQVKILLKDLLRNSSKTSTFVREIILTHFIVF